MNRDQVLETAGQLINGDRAKDYGDAAENFARIADLWTPILGKSVTATDVALCLTQLKVARLITSPGHQDSWVDAAGYIALGGEIATTCDPEPPVHILPAPLPLTTLELAQAIDDEAVYSEAQDAGEETLARGGVIPGAPLAEEQRRIEQRVISVAERLADRLRDAGLKADPRIVTRRIA